MGIVCNWHGLQGKGIVKRTLSEILGILGDKNMSLQIWRYTDRKTRGKRR